MGDDRLDGLTRLFDGYLLMLYTPHRIGDGALGWLVGVLICPYGGLLVALFGLSGVTKSGEIV